MRALRVLTTALLTSTALLAGLVAATPVTAVASVSTSQVRCTEMKLSVSLGLLSQTVHGKLCLPADSTPKTVQLLVHGGTYNSKYWDLPYTSGQYSYQRHMAASGIATFALDCLGSEGSSQPLSALVTGTAQAAVVHQVVGKLRAGKVGNTKFDKVVLVGHSMGSGIVVLEAAVYHDVDGVIFTGMTHSMNLLALVGVFIEGIRPSLLDPVLSRRPLDPGYLTTMPGTRKVFHEPGEVDPEVVAADDQTKDQVSAAVVADLLPLGFISPLSLAINVPVLMANGERDSLFCAFACSSESALKSWEAAYFSQAAQLSVHLTPNAGHSVALSKNAPVHRAAIRDWMTARFPS